MMEQILNIDFLINSIPLSLIGFWTHQIFIWMKNNEYRQNIIQDLTKEQEKNGGIIDADHEIVHQLANNTGKWLWLWVKGVALAISLRYFLVWMYQ